MRPFSSSWAERLLRNRIGSLAPNVGVFVTDLATGAQAAVNPDYLFDAGSVAKLPVAMTVLHLVTRGSLTLDTPVTYIAALDYAEGSGSLRYVIQDGDQIPISELLDRMIRVSDNVAWNMLERFVGAGTVDAYAASLGVQTPYTTTRPQLTPRDANTLLVALDSGRAGISRDLTQYLIGLMATTVFRDRIPAGVPSSAYVAEKVGTLDNAVHDVGLVYAPNRSFAISVMTANLPYDRAVRLISDLAATMYWYEDWLATA